MTKSTVAPWTLSTVSIMGVWVALSKVVVSILVIKRACLRKGVTTAISADCMPDFRQVSIMRATRLASGSFDCMHLSVATFTHINELEGSKMRLIDGLLIPEKLFNSRRRFLARLLECN